LIFPSLWWAVNREPLGLELVAERLVERSTIIGHMKMIRVTHFKILAGWNGKQ
jgi:hypothetical protein